LVEISGKELKCAVVVLLQERWNVMVVIVLLNMENAILQSTRREMKNNAFVLIAA